MLRSKEKGQKGKKLSTKHYTENKIKIQHECHSKQGLGRVSSFCSIREINFNSM
jgi:hypothetical protein